MKNQLHILEGLIQEHNDALDDLFKYYGIHKEVTPSRIIVASNNPDWGGRFTEDLNEIFFPGEPISEYSSADGQTKGMLQGLLDGAANVLKGAGKITGVFGKNDKKANTKEPLDEKADAQEIEKPKRKVLGLSMPYFIGLVAVVVLLIVWWVWKARKG